METALISPVDRQKRKPEIKLTRKIFFNFDFFVAWVLLNLPWFFCCRESCIRRILTFRQELALRISLKKLLGENVLLQDPLGLPMLLGQTLMDRFHPLFYYSILDDLQNRVFSQELFY